MNKKIMIVGMVLVFIVSASVAFSAYHHMGESDAGNFLQVYPGKTGTKLDHCALCHSGGSYINSKGQDVNLGSCQWCHYFYGYDGHDNIAYTLNQYGKDYFVNGRNANAINVIKNFDSDGDGFKNDEEIQANRFPGNAGDDPTKKVAPYRIYTRAQLEAMPQHNQFLLMNTSRSGDFYAEYTGVSMEYLLNNAGMLPTATGIKAYSPDGWSNYYTLETDPDPELYYVKGIYPSANYQYDPQADQALNQNGWCDYSAPSCYGRNHNDPIYVEGGLQMILAIQREYVYLDQGHLNQQNTLDGEGPFRIVPPQKVPSPPDQSSKSSYQDVIWPYNNDWDHNTGSSIRSVTIIKVEPLPEGTTDIDLLEAGWNYVDNATIIIYGALEDPNAIAEAPGNDNGNIQWNPLPWQGYLGQLGVYPFSGFTGSLGYSYPAYGFGGYTGTVFMGDYLSGALSQNYQKVYQVGQYLSGYPGVSNTIPIGNYFINPASSQDYLITYLSGRYPAGYLSATPISGYLSSFPLQNYQGIYLSGGYPGGYLNTQLYGGYPGINNSGNLFNIQSLSGLLSASFLTYYPYANL